MVGIINYGTYIPKYRLRATDIATAWGKVGSDIESSLGIHEKSVAGIDEDAVTMAVESASRVINEINRHDIKAVFVGSESHPYAVNPTATIVGEMLGIGNAYLAADMEFACKAGTAGMQAIAGLIEAKHIGCGLVVGTDVAQSKPHDALEYASASASVSILMGDSTQYDHVAELIEYTSYSSDTSDFWRRDGIRYPSHAGRFTGEPAYFAHISGAAHDLMQKASIKPADVTYCVFHMPNGKFPRQIAKRLGFTPEQLVPSLTVDSIGNPYSASSMLGLAAVLDIAKAGDTIFMVSYGSGAGSDGFYWKVTDGIHRQKLTVQDQLQNKKYINYVQYLKMTHKI